MDANLYDETLYDTLEGTISQESLEPTLPSSPVAINPEASALDEADVKSDTDLSRRSVESILIKSQQLLEIALNSAADNPTPRGIEAACNALNTASDIAKKLVELNERILGVQSGKQSIAGSNNTFINNTNPKIYLTTAELLKTLQDAESVKAENV